MRNSSINDVAKNFMITIVKSLLALKNSQIPVLLYSINPTRIKLQYYKLNKGLTGESGALESTN